MAVILDNTWAFCVSFDGATHNNEGYFDVRFSCGVHGKLYNFHLLALPMQNIAHTGSNYFNIVVKVLDLLYSGWKPKLHAITSDGAPVMMGVHSGINTRLKDLCQEVNSGDSVLIIWCSLHQLSLKVDYYLTKLDTSIDSRHVLNGLIGYLQKCETFYSINGKPKQYAST